MERYKIKWAIKRVNSALELFNTVAFDCDYINHKVPVMEMATGISYPTCRNPKAVGYERAISRCDPDRCPFGKEKN